MSLRIEWLFPFVGKSEYLKFASVCKSWLTFFKARKMPQITEIEPIKTREYLDWILASNAPKDVICARVLEGGELELVKRARAYDIPWCKDLYQFAVITDNVGLIRWIYEERYRSIMLAGQCVEWWTRNERAELEKALSIAAKRGNLGVLQGVYSWLGLVPSPAVYSDVLRAGKVNVLEWALKHNRDIMRAIPLEWAVIGGLDALRWYTETKYGQGAEKPCARMEKLIAHVTVPTLNYIEENYVVPDMLDSPVRVIQRGDVGVIKWFIQRGCDIYSWLDFIAAEGNLTLLEWIESNLRASLIPHARKILHGAIERKQIKVLEWYERMRLPRLSIDTWKTSFPIMKWLVERGYGPKTQEAYRYALADGVEALDWLKEHGFPLEGAEMCIMHYSYSSPFDVIKWIIENGFEKPNGVMNRALVTRDRDNIMWALEISRDEVISPGLVARLGSLEILELLYPRLDLNVLDSPFVEEAAKHGHLHLLKWAWARRIRMGPHLYSKAAEGGHLAIIQWARGEKIKWDRRTWKSAIYANQPEVLDWSLRNGCPYKWNDLYRLAGKRGTTKMINLINKLRDEEFERSLEELKA